MVNNMLLIGVVVLTSVANGSISDTLGGNHWPLCPKDRLHIVESGLVNLAKLPLPRLKAMIGKYLSEAEIRQNLSPNDGKDYREVQELRNLDIAALTRLTFVGVPRYAKGKWFGPFMDDNMWQIAGHRYKLQENSLIHMFAAAFDAKSEFKYYSHLLSRRFTKK